MIGFLHLMYLSIAVAMAGCGWGGLVSNGQVEPQQQWKALGHHSYDYDVKRSSFSTPEYTRSMRVSVRGGKVQSALYLDDATAVSGKVLKSLRTVDEWFAYIDKGRSKPFFRLDVQYHPGQGYPTRLYTDIRERVADDEQTVVISNLLPK